MGTTSLTERDLRILHVLHTHRVLTTPQLGELFFSGTSSRAAQRRLLRLAADGFTDRFLPPHTHARVPYHWILGKEGAHTLADRWGTTMEEIGYRAQTHRDLRLSSQLDHVTGLAQTYVGFASGARATQGAVLQRWWFEARCRTTWGHHVRPDGYLRWHQNGTTLDAFMEYDTGTEPLSRVETKVSRYRDLAEETNLPSPVLFVVTTPGRPPRCAASSGSAARGCRST
ncbi:MULTISPECIES: replication-relaxation family protein [Nocardiopsis]|uniref:replication-relaxation family protein n=1 Tax=Nocardiopsis TaxID=2013 RepID=UPI001D03E387|nr:MULTISPECIES: replication-relaxation family protein [Nocardiopsis]